MLDNFGLWEFLLLALMALLFFGPERLPQMGARLGRWLASLTQYSKAFMNQWSEEALAIRDAVAEVKGIRDEIVAAQAEIASSLNTARADVSETIDVARGTIKAATPSARAVLESAHGSQSTPTRAATAKESTAESGTGEVAAMAKTQQVLDDLMEKRSSSASSDASAEGDAAPVATDAKEVVSKDDAYAKNLQAIQEIMERGTRRAQASSPEVESKEPEASPVDEALSTVKPQDSPQLRVNLPDLEETTSGENAEQTISTHKTATAFDRTQRILDQLLGKETLPEEEAPAPSVEAHPPALVVPPVKHLASSVPTPTTETKRQPRKADTSGVGRSEPSTIAYAEFERLSAQVARLQDDIGSLRKELLALRAGAASAGTSSAVEQAGEAAEQPANTEQVAAGSGTRANSEEEAV